MNVLNVLYVGGFSPVSLLRTVLNALRTVLNALRYCHCSLRWEPMDSLSIDGTQKHFLLFLCWGEDNKVFVEL